MTKHRIAALAESVAVRVLKRELVLFPLGSNFGTTEPRSDGSSGKALLPLQYAYRASPEGIVTYQMRVAGDDLLYNLYSVAFPNGQIDRPTRGRLCLSVRLPSVKVGDRLRVHLIQPSAWINHQPIQPSACGHQPTRKFTAELQLSVGQHRLGRLCSHYLPFDHKPIGRDYFFGDDYVDYPQHTNTDDAVNLLRRYCAGGRLLDVGCALGLYTETFLDAGFDAYGVDISEFAISEAGKRVGLDRVQRCNLDVSDIPFEGAFDVLWMWDVLEHSVDPRKMLERVTRGASPGSWLFLHTSNSDSLTHRILGEDWEGYSDYSHHGVDSVSAVALAAWLREFGWKIVDWECTSIWTHQAQTDPVVIRLRDAFERIPELALLLSERDLGDAISVVARKDAESLTAIADQWTHRRSSGVVAE